jgi:chloramphenicol-sensitive protein RarD
MKLSKYYIAALSAFLIWGFFSLALKPLHDYPSLDILFYRVFFCAVLMLVYNLTFRKQIIKVTLKKFNRVSMKTRQAYIFYTLFGGALLIANWFFFIYVMNHISIKAASFAYLVCPIMTTVFAFIILKEELSRIQWLAVAISVVSCVLLSFNHVADILYSLIVAATYALYLVSQKKNKGLDKFLVLTVQIVFAALVLLPFYPVYSGPVPTEFSFYGLIAIIAVLFTIIPLFLNLYALQGVNSSTMGILLYINPLVGFLIAIFYFNEGINTVQMIAYFLIFCSIIIFNERLFLRSKNAVQVV